MAREKEEVLRYLGRRGQLLSPELDALVGDCMHLIREASAPRHVRRVFDIGFQTDGISLAHTGVWMPGTAISHHLAGCVRATVLAATLGVGADNLIRRWESIDLTRALVLDACATQFIEEYCDETQQHICREAQESGLATVPRFSPGYGDLPLDTQPNLLALLDAGRKIGLTCTEHFILLPRKSVTALIGLGRNPHAGPGGCGDCSLRGTCAFEKGDVQK